MNPQTMSPSSEPVTYVLVEEEQAIRDEWLRISRAKGISLMTYPDAEWFLDDIGRDVFRGHERFYLDQDFGSVRGVGLQLSRRIKALWPNAYTALVTAYPKFMFRRELLEGAVNEVFGKYPSPFDNPKFTAFEENYERGVWVPLIGTMNGFNG
ncbi:hypothetical protein WDW37_09385 [Bdellovibrionota bacterium FG-1]